MILIFFFTVERRRTEEDVMGNDILPIEQNLVPSNIDHTSSKTSIDEQYQIVIYCSPKEDLENLATMNPVVTGNMVRTDNKV